MTVKDLIKQLQKLPQDLKVSVWADHGQSYEIVSDIDISYVSEDRDYARDPEDLEDDENLDDFNKEVVIWGN